eukprot:755207-Hanusia_phi.AAC.6
MASSLLLYPSLYATSVFLLTQPSLTSPLSSSLSLLQRLSFHSIIAISFPFSKAHRSTLVKLFSSLRGSSWRRECLEASREKS